MYFTAAISVFLVLLMIGVECVLLLSAVNAVSHFKENAVVTAMLSGNVDSVGIAQVDSQLHAWPYFSKIEFTSRQQALEQHIDELGEDPTELLGFNPLFDSYDLHPTAEYSTPEGMEEIAEKLEELPQVDRVMYQKDLVQQIERNINKASVVLMLVAIVLLLIAMLLIVNTIRLQIYSKRFLINTMTLVGATGWHIKAPFVGKNVLMGLIAGLCALLVLGLSVLYLRDHMDIILFPLNAENILIISGVVLGCGLMLTLLASLIATGRYIRMSTDTMYEI
ncbi:MAG: permease-like cell division protein FtsX [Paludibacteraceae bacterium]|nr:permease-like cell division protein FtsX [Paludibacteraceae bacterium]